MIRKLRKGFTIVELVIVIAVIAVLTAVLIPTFVHLSKKANKASDNSLVANLNTALAMEASESGKAPKTMHDAVVGLENQGYKVPQLVTKSEEKLVYSIDDNKFYLSGDVTPGVGYWRIYTASAFSSRGSEEFSAYAIGDGWSTVSDLRTGFDAGEVEGISSVSFIGGNDVIIRTNGGILTVNAPTDDVHHYGYAEKVDIKDVKATSYHENGDVELIKVQKGHVELETSSQVLGVYVYTENASAGFADIKITVNQGAEVPQLSRSAVQIAETGTKICTVVTEEAKDIYLFQQGVYEQIKTVDEGKDVTSDASASWADDTSNNNAKTQTAAQQLANELNSSFTVGDTTYSVEVVDREVVVINTSTSQPVTDPTIVADAVDQSGKDESEATSCLGLFGKGTQNDPFLIYDFATMQKISNYYTDGYYYYSVAIERTENGIIDCSGWTPVRLHGSFNGNGVKFINLNKHLFAAIVGVKTDGSAYSGNAGFYTGSAGSFNNSTPITVENFTIEAQIKGTAVAAGVANSVGTNITFKNINVNGYIEGYTASGIANYGAYQFGDDPSRNPEYTQFRCNLTFENCNVSATLVALNEGAAGLIQHPYSNANSVWTITNCTINAEMYAKNYNKAPRTYLYNYQQPSLTLIIDGEETHVTSSIKYTGMKAHTLIYNSPALSAPANKGDNFTIAATANASYAMFGLIISPNPGSMTATYINERVELNGNSFTSNLIKYCDVKINTVNAAPGYNGDYTVYNVNSTAFNGTSNGQYVQVVQYAADGSILSISTCNLSLISQ